MLTPWGCSDCTLDSVFLFNVRIFRGCWCVGRIGMPSSGKAAQSRTLPVGATRRRFRVLPQSFHLTMAYCQSVRRRRAVRATRATYTTASFNSPNQPAKVAVRAPQSHHRGLGLKDPCLDIECCNGIISLNKFKWQILSPRWKLSIWM
jgi:hypothetical protein